MTNQKPLAGRNVGVLVYNGDEWRKLRGDAEGRLLVAGQQPGQRPTSRIRSYTIWDTSVGAGETFTILDTTSGRGRIIHCFLRVVGQAGPAAWTRMEFFVDGDTSPSFSTHPDYIYTFFLGRRLVDISLAGCSLFDTTNHIYEVWFDIGPTFNSSLKMTVKNGDNANAITVRCGIWVEWWE